MIFWVSSRFPGFHRLVSEFPCDVSIFYSYFSSHKIQCSPQVSDFSILSTTWKILLRVYYKVYWQDFCHQITVLLLWLDPLDFQYIFSLSSWMKNITYLVLICHILPPALQLFIGSFVPLLLTLISIGILTFCPTILMNVLTYSIHCIAAMTFASVINKATMSCILLLVATGTPFARKYLSFNHLFDFIESTWSETTQRGLVTHSCKPKCCNSS